MGISYRDLRVWRSSMKLVVSIYETTQALPKSEPYGLAKTK